MISYRTGYKYVLNEEYTVHTALRPDEDIVYQFISLDATGLLTIREGFPWDGSTCALDTKKSRRGSLIHDALYRLMNLGFLDWKHKLNADYEYYKALRDDGFSERWAKIRYRAVKKFGGAAKKTAHTLEHAP